MPFAEARRQHLERLVQYMRQRLAAWRSQICVRTPLSRTATTRTTGYPAVPQRGACAGPARFVAGLRRVAAEPRRCRQLVRRKLTRLRLPVARTIGEATAKVGHVFVHVARAQSAPARRLPAEGRQHPVPRATRGAVVLARRVGGASLVDCKVQRKFNLSHVLRRPTPLARHGAVCGSLARDPAPSAHGSQFYGAGLGAQSILLRAGMSRWRSPPSQMRSNGLRPASFRCAGSAPRSISSAAIAAWPQYAARCSGVSPGEGSG